MSNRLTNKLFDDAFSIKIWILFISVGFLASGTISDAVFCKIVVAILGLREASELRQNIWGDKSGTDPAS